MSNIKRHIFSVILLSEIFVVLTVAGCINSSSAAESATYKIDSNGWARGIENQQFHVVNTATQYSLLMSGLYLSGNIPAPDFSVVTLIAVFAGYKSSCTSDASLTVTNVVDLAESVAVSLRQTESSGTCLASIPSSGPYVFIEIPKTSKPISLIVNAP